MTTKEWTPTEQLAAINKAAQIGFYSGGIEYYVLIGALTNASSELLNTDENILSYLKELEEPKPVPTQQ